MVHRIVGIRARRSGIALLPLALGAASLLALVLPSSPASAFCRTTTCAVRNPPPECVRDDSGCWMAGIPLFWEQQCVSYAVSTAGSPVLGLDLEAAQAIVDKGFSLWPNAMCADGFPSIAYASRSGLTCDRVEYNPTGPNSNAILFRDDGWTHDASAIALTTVAFSVKTGKILDADMEINSGQYPLSTLDLEFVIAHESGHFGGLDHSARSDAVMFFQYASGNTGDTQLTPDDVDAICAAYPPARVVGVCDFEPDKGFAVDCGGDVKASCAIAPAPPADGSGSGGSRPGWKDPGGWLAVAIAIGGVVRGGSRRRRQASQPGSRPRSA
jgi:hypothetical protein